ncbi:uncharacterized protein LOC108152560 [Drosophila miranda]|uniref:uncharacterized protein LOC108152560 n=1 Tax=Drosophila miranda TaxID=7229 RepID=UPI0007E63CEA|nr:uncharacterized protein LOC108152560 [Drosophila miranda]
MSLSTCACGCSCGCGCVRKPKSDEPPKAQASSHSISSKKGGEPADNSKAHDEAKSHKTKPKEEHGSSHHHFHIPFGHSGSHSKIASDEEKEGDMVGRQLTPYECQLEDDVQQLQEALFTLTSHYAKVQFRLRQIAAASDCERITLLKELERMTCEPLDGSGRDQEDKLHTLQSDATTLGSVRVKQHKIITQLRGRLQNLAEAAADYFVMDRDGQKRDSKGDGAESHDFDEQGYEGLQGKASKATFLSEAWSDTIYEDTENDVNNSSRSKSNSKNRKGKGKKKDKRTDKKSDKKTDKKTDLKTDKKEKNTATNGGAGDRHSRRDCSKDCPAYRARRKSGSVSGSVPNTSSKILSKMSSKDLSPSRGRLYAVLRETQSLPHYQRRTGEETALKKVRSTAKNHLEAVQKGSRCKPDIHINRKPKANGSPSENLAKGWPLSWKYLKLDEPPCSGRSANTQGSSMQSLNKLRPGKQGGADMWSDVREETRKHPHKKC